MRHQDSASNTPDRPTHPLDFAGRHRPELHPLAPSLSHRGHRCAARRLPIHHTRRITASRPLARRLQPPHPRQRRGVPRISGTQSAGRMAAQAHRTHPLPRGSAVLQPHAGAHRQRALADHRHIHAARIQPGAMEPGGRRASDSRRALHQPHAPHVRPGAALLHPA